MDKLRQAGLLFVMQLVSYCVICINIRAVASADMRIALWSDALIASLNFLVFRRIAREADAFHLWAGYVLGSLAGTAAGIHLSTRMSHA